MIKDEENEQNPEVYEPEYLHHSWAQYDSESNVQSPVSSHDIPSLNSDDLNPLDPLDGDHCGKTLDKKNQIGSHRKGMKVHNIKAEQVVEVASEVEKNKKFSCPKCPQWFHLQHRLDGHIRSKHEGLKVLLVLSMNWNYPSSNISNCRHMHVLSVKKNSTNMNHTLTI